MMYGGSDAAAHLGSSARRPESPRDGVLFLGLERRRRRRFDRDRLLGAIFGRGALRENRHRGVLRLPGQPPPRPDRRDPSARDLLAFGRNSRSPRSSRTTRPGDRAGRRAFDALAFLQLFDRGLGRGFGRATGGHARSPARRRAPHPASGNDRLCLRRLDDRADRPEIESLRGSHRDRGRAARQVHRSGFALSQRVGERPSLRRRGRLAEGGLGTVAQAGDDGRCFRGRLRVGRGRRRVRAPGWLGGPV